MPESSQVTDYRSVWTYLNTVPHRLDWVDAGGVRTRYLESGRPDAPVVILLHGTAGSLENFCANYGPLAEDHRVIGLDLLGCGYTDKPDRPYLIEDYAAHVLDVLDALGIEEAALIGVSLGSWVGARLASDHPDRVAGLVMVAPAGIIIDADEEKAFGAGVRQRRQNAAQAPTWESVTTAMSRLVLKPEDLIDDLVGVRLRIYQQPEMAHAMPHLLAFTSGGQDLSEAEWAALDVPVLVVAAVDAPNMFLANARRLAEILPRVEVVELSDCDHWAQFERADEFNAAAGDFLAGLPREHA